MSHFSRYRCALLHNIFNPRLRGERFDRDGEFIRQWLPALRDILEKRFTSRGGGRKKRGVGSDYHSAYCGHKRGENRETLSAYEAAREGVIQAR